MRRIAVCAPPSAMLWLTMQGATWGMRPGRIMLSLPNDPAEGGYVVLDPKQKGRCKRHRFTTARTVAGCDGFLISHGKKIPWHGRPASSLYTTHHPCGADAVYHGLKFRPAAPQHEPARRAVVRSIEVSAKFRQCHAKLMNAHVQPDLLEPPVAQGGDVFLIDHVGGRSGGRVVAARQVTQSQQLRCHHRLHADRH